jgi:hypothetical protein
MLTIRQELVAAVVARFGGITVAGGYLTDTGKNVVLWAVNPLPQEKLPGIVVRDRRCETTLVGRVAHEHRYYFEADLYSPIAVDVRAVLADVQKAIAVDIRWLVGGRPLAVDTQPLDDELDRGQEERLLNGCRYRFVVIVRTKPFSPFNLASPT